MLDAAARVFAEKGYFGAKIMDIVRAAGLSSGAIYGRFDSKDELLMEAVLSQVEQNAVGSRFLGKTVGEIVMETSRTDGALDDAEATQLEAFVAARREPKVAAAIAEARRGGGSTIGEPLIQQAIAEGAAGPEADFDSIIYFLEALNLGLLVQRGAGQLPPDPEAWTRFLARVIRAMGQMPAKPTAPRPAVPRPPSREHTTMPTADLLAPTFWGDVDAMHAFFTEVRAAGPVWRDEANGLWAVVRHAELLDVERRADVFTSRPAYRSWGSAGRDGHDRPGRSRAHGAASRRERPVRAALGAGDRALLERIVGHCVDELVDHGAARRRRRGRRRGRRPAPRPADREPARVPRGPLAPTSRAGRSASCASTGR